MLLYRAALTSQLRCSSPPRSMGKSSSPKPSHDSPTASAERALIGARLDEAMVRLHRLEAERVEAKARVEALRGELGTFALDRDVESGGPTNPPRTAFEKVMLFRQLFRGREDLYPVRFVSKGDW